MYVNIYAEHSGRFPILYFGAVLYILYRNPTYLSEGLTIYVVQVQFFTSPEDMAKKLEKELSDSIEKVGRHVSPRVSYYIVQGPKIFKGPHTFRFYLPRVLYSSYPPSPSRKRVGRTELSGTKTGTQFMRALSIFSQDFPVLSNASSLDDELRDHQVLLCPSVVLCWSCLLVLCTHYCLSRLTGICRGAR